MISRFNALPPRLSKESIGTLLVQQSANEQTKE